MRHQTCKPNSVTVLLPLTVIPLGRSSLNGSSDLPGSLAHRAGTHEVFPPHSFPIWSCSVWGLPCPVHYCPSGALLPHLFTLTAPVEHLRFSGLRLLCLCVRLKADRLSPFTYLRRYILCGTFHQVVLKPPSRTLSGTLLSGVRTFLSSGRAARAKPGVHNQNSDHPARYPLPYYRMDLCRRSSAQGSALTLPRDRPENRHWIYWFYRIVTQNESSRIQ
jgi:hypothetical protein